MLPLEAQSTRLNLSGSGCVSRCNRFHVQQGALVDAFTVHEAIAANKLCYLSSLTVAFRRPTP